MSIGRYSNFNPYELHKHLINQYVLNRKGATSFLKRDTSRDKRDIDIIRENHKFLWDDDDVPTSWEERLARKYYEKLFKEYCISDLSRYKENKFAMRWQTEQELVTGKGQFICGAKNCLEKEILQTWEVNFAYIEHGEKKNALVKLRLCKDCSKKLNHKHKRKEVKRIKLIKDKPSTNPGSLESKTNEEGEKLEGEDGEEKGDNSETLSEESNIWRAPVEQTEETSRDEEFEKYLEQLLL